jgi:hypothetical protein
VHLFCGRNCAQLRAFTRHWSRVYGSRVFYGSVQKPRLRKPRLRLSRVYGSRVYGSVQKPRLRKPRLRLSTSRASEMPRVRNPGNPHFRKPFTEAAKHVYRRVYARVIAGHRRGGRGTRYARGETRLNSSSRVTVDRSFCTRSYGKTADSWNIEKWLSTAVSGSKARCGAVVRCDARLFQPAVPWP